jgi:hypothetical protein
MAERKRKKASQPLCPEHWQKMRKEMIKVLPFWTRPFASGQVNKKLAEKGFVQSDSACAFCGTNTDVDKVD